MKTIHGAKRPAKSQDGRTNMEQVYSYIDKCLIEEYGIPNYELNTFDLDIDDVPETEINNVLDRLMKEDSSLREMIHLHIQGLIEKRLREATL